jgi:organic radical activating enzyme
MIKYYPHPSIKGHVAVFTGDTCNLACVLCGPDASTLWQYELGIKQKRQTIVEDFNFVGYNSVLFTGGEPFLNRHLVEILQKLDKDTKVLIHTNGTVLPSQEQIDACKKFTNISFIFSIDDIEEQFEFLRYPAKWCQVTDNILHLKKTLPKNISMAFLTVVSMLNEPTYLRVESWVRDNFSLEIPWGTQDANGIFNKMKYSTCIGECIKFLDSLDARRKTDWKKIFPHAVKLLNLD